MRHNVSLSKQTLSMRVLLGPLKFCRQEIENITFSTRFWTEIDKFGGLDGAQEAPLPGLPRMF